MKLPFERSENHLVKGIKLTRHNGRYGKNGVYNTRHNDRDFKIENSEHIDGERTSKNVYWDTFQGYRFHDSKEEVEMKFLEVEERFYQIRYFDYSMAQNERNEKARHPERNKTPLDILKNKKTCPEETIYQLGKMDESIDPENLAIICAEFFEEFEKKYGEHIHILDWALHVDEKTPHIHERHVFDAVNQYGEICPQQDEALKQLGFELPYPNKKQGKHNNRKMTFDKVCRERFMEICHEHGIYPDEEPVYGGKEHQEKQEYIREKTKEQIAELETQLVDVNERLEENERKLSDTNALIDEISEVAYEKAIELVSYESSKATREEDIAAINHQIEWLSSDERKASKEKRSFAVKYFEGLKEKISKLADGVAEKIKDFLLEPKKKTENVNVIAVETKKSFMDQITEAKKEAEEINKSNLVKKIVKKKQQGIDDD